MDEDVVGADPPFAATVVASLRGSLTDAEAPDEELVYRTLVDFLGCLAGGLRVPFVAELRGRLLGIDPGWVVCGPGRGAAPRDAAMANATAAHSQDFDDTHWSSTLHPSAVVWGALLAADGIPDDALPLAVGYRDAVALISDLATFVCPAHIRRGWHSTSTVGALAAAAAVSRARGHELDRTVRAVGVAGTLVGGLRRNNASSAKALHAGRAAATAVLACDVAELDDFDGQVSLAAVGDAFGLVPADVPTAASAADMTFKPYPTCSGTHAAIEAALPHSGPEAPSKVVVRVPAIVGEETHCGWPEGMASARLSLPYVVAVALAYGDVEEDGLERGRSDSRVRALFDRIEVEVAPAVPHEPYRSAATLELAWSDRTATRTVDRPKGDPRRPMTTAELEAKMRHQASAVWSDRRQDALLRSARQFARGGSPAELLALAARTDVAAGPGR